MSSEANPWTLKQFQKDGAPDPWIFRKNAKPEIEPRHPDYNHVAYFTFHFVPRDPSGLPTKEDGDALYEIEDQRLGVLEADSLSIMVGVVLKPGIKDFIFYTRDAHEFLRRAAPIRDASFQFDVECEIGPDPEWTHYEDLP